MTADRHNEEMDRTEMAANAPALKQNRDYWRGVAESRTAELREVRRVLRSHGIEDPTGIAVPSDHTATTEDAARALYEGISIDDLWLNWKQYQRGDEWFAFTEGARAGIEAAAGLLTTARPDTTEAPAQARIHALTTPHGDPS